LDLSGLDFRTRFFKPELSDDVVGYMPKDEVVQFLNQILGKSFQVR